LERVKVSRIDGLCEGVTSPDISFQLDRARELRREGRFVEALALFEDALLQRPDSSRGHAGYAFTLAKTGRIQKAIQSYREALRLRPDSPRVWAALGDAYLLAGDVALAIESIENAIGLNGDSDLHSNLLYLLNLAPWRTPSAIYRAHAAWGRCHADGRHVTHGNLPAPERTLRIGYVSAFFRRHNTYSFLASLLEEHDRSAVHVSCYDNTEEPDEFTARLQGSAAGWRRIRGMPDEEAAALVRGDAIDILVDLSGHTAGNRLPLFALKPAPVQVTYLGYPNTTGLPGMDYRITDSIADPPGQSDALHTEELIRLPRCFLAYTPCAECGEIAGCPALRKACFTFGSFSNPLKWNDTVIEAWSAILNRVPDSRLILHHGTASNKTADVIDALGARVLGKFVANGIDGARIVLTGFLSPPEHFALYHEVDLALDPFPYNGTTAVCEGLWMGVPAIALTGQTHVSRVATSLLSGVGLSRFAAMSIEDYVDLAVAVAGDRKSLAALRSTLRSRMAESPVMDGRGLARAIEEAYRRIWRRWCDRQLGQPS
jgi:predicted O-linked N-acetylglucosamine transferase (SPINDLY family)